VFLGDRLKQQFEILSGAEQEQERLQRRTRVRIRADRLAEFQRFREETYQLVSGSGQTRYAIGVQDTSLEEAVIEETITLPEIPGSTNYPPTPVHFTPAQREGYLFLAKLGAMGGDPLARSVLVSP